MLWIWFGLDGTGVQRSVELHWILGPTVVIAFAFLGNTLFLTILVAMLSNTYHNLALNATAEIQFRRAVLTFEGVKSDSLFSYRPPLNAVALVLMLPLKFILNPRWFHKVIPPTPLITQLKTKTNKTQVNVLFIRLHNAPILLLITLLERRYLWHRANSTRSWTTTMWGRFGAHGDLHAVFDAEPPQEIIDELDDLDDVLPTGAWETNNNRRNSHPASETSGAAAAGTTAGTTAGTMAGTATKATTRRRRSTAVMMGLMASSPSTSHWHPNMERYWRQSIGSGGGGGGGGGGGRTSSTRDELVGTEDLDV